MLISLIVNKFHTEKVSVCLLLLGDARLKFVEIVLIARLYFPDFGLLQLQLLYNLFILFL